MSLSYQSQHRAPVTKADLTGKVVVVIGANGGLGYEAAKHFASMNPLRLILTSRDNQRGEDALKGTFGPSCRPSASYTDGGSFERTNWV